MKHLLSIIFISALITAAVAQQAAITKHEMSTASHAQLDSLFRYLDTAGLYNGVILVGIGDKVIDAAAIGYANLATGEQLTMTSTFELASVSKQFTAVGILRLVDKGRLRLDQTIDSLFPALPYKGISIRHLLNHTGGLPDYEELFRDHWDRKKIAINEDILAMLVKHHPEASFAPGTAWEYSNTGYAMLALVIERISGKSYADYMKAEVFKPAGLEHTFIYMRRFAPKAVRGYAYGYVKDNKGTYLLPDSLELFSYVRYLDGIGGDGTVNTTASDLLQWNNVVRTGKLLPPSLWKEALTAPVIGGKSTGYGFGLELVTNPERGRVARHTGGWPGYVTNNVLYLDKDVSLIFLSNMEKGHAGFQPVYDAVKNIVFGLPFSFPKERRIAAIDKKVYERYAGTYITPEMEGFEITMTARDGHLYTQATGQSELEILPESKTVFFMEDMPISIEFKTEASGPASGFILNQNGRHEFARKK